MNEQHDSDRVQPPTTRPQAGQVGTAIDDAALGAMVRDAAERWVVPPQRLGRPTWRDLVERRVAGRSGWGRRLGGAAAGALLATLALALVAVWLSTPRPPAQVAGPGATPGQSGPSAGANASPPAPPSSSSPAAPPSAAASNAASTPLPDRLVDGPPLSQPTVLVGADASYRMLDLATGQLGPIIGDRSSGLSRIWRLADGSYVCACVRRTLGDDAQKGLVDGVSIAISRFDSSGSPTGTVAGPTYQSPTNTTSQSLATPSIDVAVAASPDLRWFYVGSSVFLDGRWQVGVDVVDGTDGRVTETIPMEGVVAIDSTGLSHFATAPRVVVAPDGGHVALITTIVTDPIGEVATARSIRGVDGQGSLLPGATLPSLPGSASSTGNCAGAVEGFATATTYYVICPDTTPTVDRFGLDGTLIGSTPLDVAVASYPAAPVLDPATATLFTWNPFEHRLSAIDLRTGRVSDSVVAPAATAGSSDVLGGLARSIARWLAPSAAAKVALTPGLVLSPDGRRIFALGVTGQAIEEPGGSSGVYVFDTAPLQFVKQLAPTADFFSLGLSRDGSVLYAAGIPGVDASGARTDQAASVTAFDVVTGQVRAVFGKLPETVDFQDDGRP